jgi:hypothetical protein
MLFSGIKYAVRLCQSRAMDGRIAEPVAGGEWEANRQMGESGEGELEASGEGGEHGR